MIHSEAKDLFAVLVNRQTRPKFALNGQGGPALFRNRKDCKAFCDELQTHLESPCEVVPVRSVVGLTETDRE